MTTKTASARTQTGPDGETYNTAIDSQFIAWEQAWRTYNREVKGIPCGCTQTHDFICDGMKGDASIVSIASDARKAGGVEKTPEQKQALAEAIAYIRDYRGNWGFILDLRADPKFNTKWFRLSERQIEVILNAKKRDAVRATEQAASIPADQTALVNAALQAMIDNPADRPEFIVSICAQGTQRTLSEKQVACLVRFTSKTGTAAAAPKARVEVAEGWYMVEKVPFKVQHNLAHTGIYAKRLTPEGWEYVQGGIRLIAEKGEPMTLDAAKQYGALYGRCAVCGRELTDETSIAEGVGPVCAGRIS